LLQDKEQLERQVSIVKETVNESALKLGGLSSKKAELENDVKLTAKELKEEEAKREKELALAEQKQKQRLETAAKQADRTKDRALKAKEEVTQQL
jgi:hypothetical protein